MSLSWKQTQEDGVAVFHLTGTISEGSPLDDFGADLPESAVIDLNDVEYINSAGTREWIEFATRMRTANKSLRFRRCSVAFVGLANIVANLTMGFPMESFLAPFVCPECDHEDAKVVTVGPETQAEVEKPMSCSECSAEMEFDEIPEQYLQFLQR